jgi:hypothetical protein
MDEVQFHGRRTALGGAPCVFEKALLAGCARCALARRHALAEREVVTCTLAAAGADCATLSALLRERSRFALKLPVSSAPAPHAVAMKLQCGGLAGLQRALAATGADVHCLVTAAKERWGSLPDLPWQHIVRSVGAWQGRRRHRAKDKP